MRDALSKLNQHCVTPTTSFMMAFAVVLVVMWFAGYTILCVRLPTPQEKLNMPIKVAM